MTNPTNPREPKKPMSESQELRKAMQQCDHCEEVAMNPEEPKYTVEMVCENCLKTFRKDFEKGSSCRGFYKCEHCGCREARMK